jgi:hypothetical protein
MTRTPFAGETHAPMRSPLANLERRVIQRTVGRFPRWIEGYHLTLMTVAWSAGVVLFGWLAQADLRWLWGTTAMLAGQWFTDSFDGALGRLRDSGIPRWGFYMDHFLDFVFMWCVPASYALLVAGRSRVLVVVFAFLYSAMMANAFLEFAATGNFRITYLGVGPTEIRLGYAAINTAIIFLGTGFLERALPWAVGAFGAALLVIVLGSQRRIWTLDMRQRVGSPTEAGPRRSPRAP